MRAEPPALIVSLTRCDVSVNLDEFVLPQWQSPTFIVSHKVCAGCKRRSDLALGGDSDVTLRNDRLTMCLRLNRYCIETNYQELPAHIYVARSHTQKQKERQSASLYKRVLELCTQNFAYPILWACCHCLRYKYPKRSFV